MFFVIPRLTLRQELTESPFLPPLLLRPCASYVKESVGQCRLVPLFQGGVSGGTGRVQKRGSGQLAQGWMLGVSTGVHVQCHLQSGAAFLLVWLMENWRP